MKRKIMILAIVLLVIVNITALVTIAYNRWFVRGSFPDMRRPDMPMFFIKQELDLSEQQVKKIDSQVERFKTETEPILDSLRTKRKIMLEEIAVEQPDIDKLDMIAEEIGALHVALRKKMIANLLAEKSILTPEQRKKFFSIFKERQARRGKMKGRGKGMGRGPWQRNF